MASGLVPGENNLIVASKFARIRPLARDPFFEVANVAADFSALEAKGGDDVAVRVTPRKLGAHRLDSLLVAVAP